MTEAAPTIHPLAPDDDAATRVLELTAPDRPRPEAGLHVVVHVAEGGNTAYGRIEDPTSPGHGSQRWLQHARRGSSPGGWTEQHHPRSETEVGAWKERAAAGLDRQLIERCRQAWRLEQDPPYLVEFAPVALADVDVS
ncbi:MAG: hypothetical protein JWM98_1325 [Thermoleophilia bacterium]|nr:hypothetical protein [Thermoleophilia bacterium]